VFLVGCLRTRFYFYGQPCWRRYDQETLLVQHSTLSYREVRVAGEVRIGTATLRRLPHDDGIVPPADLGRAIDSLDDIWGGTYRAPIMWGLAIYATDCGGYLVEGYGFARYCPLNLRLSRYAGGPSCVSAGSPVALEKNRSYNEEPIKGFEMLVETTCYLATTGTMAALATKSWLC
jgi:hypothetical protein